MDLSTKKYNRSKVILKQPKGTNKENSLLPATFFFISLLLFISSFPNIQTAQAAGNTYYVATNGHDSNPGTSAAPFRTIQHAADIVNPGDTVIVRNGTYTDVTGNDSMIWLQRSGTAAAPITFKSENKWGAKIDGGNTVGSGFSLNASYIVVQDFEITNMTGDGLGSNYGSGYAAVTNVTIRGNHLHHIGRVCDDEDIGNEGIFAAGVSAWTVEGNLFNDIGRFAPGENGCNPTNWYYTNHDHGMYLHHVQDFTIQNNIFYNMNRGWGVQLAPGPNSNIKILNNTFAFSNPYQPGQIILLGSASDIQIKNNIFYQPGTAGITCYGLSGTNYQVSNNITYGGVINTVGGDVDCSSSHFQLSNNRDNLDPQLVSPSTFDFHLQSNSPAINTGSAISTVSADFDGFSRIGLPFDIGAYEFGSGSPIPIPSSYSCFDGVLCDQSHITGTPGQIVCGADYKNWTCTSTGWQSVEKISCSCGATPTPPPPPATSGTGHTYYVATTGNDSNPGTSTAPFRTIQHAADIVNPGDTVLVGDGTYTQEGQAVVRVTRGGTSNNWVTFKSINRGGAKLNGQNFTTDTGFAMTQGNPEYVEINGFEIYAMKGAGVSLNYVGANHYRVIGNHIHSIGRICVPAHDTGITGIYTSARDTYVEGNIFHDIGRFANGENGCVTTDTNHNHDHGIYAAGNGYSGGHGSEDLTIVNNVFYDFPQGWPIAPGPGDVTNMIVANNTIIGANPTQDGVVLFYASPTVANVQIKNNIFVGGGAMTGAIYYCAAQGCPAPDPKGTYTNVVVQNNLVYNAAIDKNNNGEVVASGTVTANPAFVNYTGGDFHLTSGSQAINAGVTTSFTTDINGTTRTGNYDIGAYEFGGVINPPSPPPPPSGPSASGSRIPNNMSSIVDNGGVTWTLGESYGGGANHLVLQNGANVDGVGSEILWYNNIIYVLGTDNNWYQWTGSGFNKIRSLDPQGNLTSPSGSRIPNNISSIVDHGDVTWTMGESSGGGSNHLILQNGIPVDGVGSQILWYNNVIYVLGTDNNWYQWTGSGYIRLGANDPSGSASVPPPEDKTPPTISISSPSTSTVSGQSAMVSATVTDNVRVAGVQFQMDGTNLAVEDTTDPYAVNWNTTTVANGTHTLTVIARDLSNNSTSSSKMVGVLNAERVNNPPTVNAGSDLIVTLPNSVSLNGTATDDGVPIGRLTTTWSQKSGPGQVALGSASQLQTTASFSISGTYVLQLTANDGEKSSVDEMTVVVKLAAADTTAPVFKAGPTVYASRRSATISWSTNESATAEIRYGKTTAYGTAINKTGLSTSRFITLSNLNRNTNYYYKVTVKDKAGNTRSVEKSFKTNK